MSFRLYLFYASLHIFYVLSFVFAILAIYRKSLPYYMNGFFWYPLIGVVLISSFWLAVVGILPFPVYNTLNRLSLVFHYAFISIFICNVLKSRGSIVTEVILSIFFLVVTIILVTVDIINNSKISYPIVNMIVFVFCINYYFRICMKPSSIRLINDPSFWVVSGVFLCMGMTIPIHLFNKFLAENLMKSYYTQVMLTGAIGYSLMHISFVKALTCKM